MGLKEYPSWRCIKYNIKQLVSKFASRLLIEYNIQTSGVNLKLMLTKIASRISFV